MGTKVALTQPTHIRIGVTTFLKELIAVRRLQIKDYQMERTNPTVKRLIKELMTDVIAAERIQKMFEEEPDSIARIE